MRPAAPNRRIHCRDAVFAFSRQVLGLLLCLAGPGLAHAAGLLAIENPAHNGQETQTYAEVEAFEGNDQVAMRQYSSNWQGSYTPRTDQNLGLLAARAEIGAQWQGYRLGLLYRADALAQTNRDTADLAHQYNTNQGYDTGRNYRLDYQIQGFEATGTRLSKSAQWTLGGAWQLDVGMGLAYLQGLRLKLGSASGQVASTSARDFNASVNLSETTNLISTTDLASFNAPYGRQVTASGQGYAVDAGLVLRHQPSGIGFEVAVADLVGQMDWKYVPSNLTDYNTATKYFDSNGYARFNPAATRTSSYQNVSQALDPKLWLAANYPVGDLALQFAVSATQGFRFPQAGFSYRINPEWVIKADLDFRFSTVGLSLLHAPFYFGLRTENLNLDSAKAYGLNAGVRIAL